MKYAVQKSGSWVVRYDETGPDTRFKRPVVLGTMGQRKLYDDAMDALNEIEQSCSTGLFLIVRTDGQVIGQCQRQPKGTHAETTFGFLRAE